MDLGKGEMLKTGWRVSFSKRPFVPRVAVPNVSELGGSRMADKKKTLCHYPQSPNTELVPFRLI